MYSCILVVWRELKFGSLFLDFLGGLDTTVSMLTLIKGLEDNTFHLKFLFCVLRNSDNDEPIVTNSID